MALTAFVADTRRGINGLVSMRWVFLGASDVPAHAKSGITARQTGALWSDGRPSAHLAAQDGDKWRTLPAECTHISNSITLSQHRNSHCQSAASIYANMRKSANISTQSVTAVLAYFYIRVSCMPSFLEHYLCSVCVCVCVCVCVRVSVYVIV